MPKVMWMKPPPKVNYLAAVFRTYRKERGMTSEDIGKALGCSPENVRCQLNKPAEKWNIGQLLRYCDVLGIPYDVALHAAAHK